jgi:hypothetical protein
MKYEQFRGCLECSACTSPNRSAGLVVHAGQIPMFLAKDLLCGACDAQRPCKSAPYTPTETHRS